jgi:hypothetical protein
MFTNAEYKRIWWITATYYKLLYYPSIFLKEKPHSGLLLLNTTDCKTQTDRKWTQMSRHNAGKSIQMTANKHDVVNFNTYYPPTCNKKCQMFSSNNMFFWYVTWLFSISNIYFQMFTLLRQGSRLLLTSYTVSLQDSASVKQIYASWVTLTKQEGNPTLPPVVKH